MKLLSLFLALVVLSSTAQAQRFRRFRQNTYQPSVKKTEAKSEPKMRPMMEVDENEIKRWGNIVQRVGPGVWSDPGINAFGAAMGTPTSERHKWFISIVVDDSPESVRLVKDFLSNADLRVWANPIEPKQSWSHYRVYKITDKSQSFRFKNLSLQGFPTLLIQPPLNKEYGDPHSVVGQILCRDGDCKKLSKNIRASIGVYIKAQQSKGTPRQGPNRRPAKKPASKKQSPEWSKPKAKPKSSRGSWGQLDAPIPEGAFAQDPVERRRPFQPGPAPFDTDGPIRPNVRPNLPNVTPVQVLPPSNEPDEIDEEDSKYADGPEAIVISDAAIGISEANNGRIRSLIRGLRLKRFKDLRVRYIDLEDAKRKGIPVDSEDLPTVVLTNRRRILDKISGALLPNVETEPRAAPTVSDLPWNALVSLLFGGGGIVAGIQLAFFGLRWFRRRRRSQGKQPILSDTAFESLLTTAGPFLENLIEKLITKTSKPEKK